MVARLYDYFIVINFLSASVDLIRHYFHHQTAVHPCYLMIASFLSAVLTIVRTRNYLAIAFSPFVEPNVDHLNYPIVFCPSAEPSVV